MATVWQEAAGCPLACGGASDLHPSSRDSADRSAGLPVTDFTAPLQPLHKVGVVGEADFWQRCKSACDAEACWSGLNVGRTRLHALVMFHASNRAAFLHTGAASSSCQAQEAFSHRPLLPRLWPGGLHVRPCAGLHLRLSLLLHTSGESQMLPLHANTKVQCF